MSPARVMLAAMEANMQDFTPRFDTPAHKTVAAAVENIRHGDISKEEKRKVADEIGSRADKFLVPRTILMRRSFIAGYDQGQRDMSGQAHAHANNIAAEAQKANRNTVDRYRAEARLERKRNARWKVIWFVVGGALGFAGSVYMVV